MAVRVSRYGVRRYSAAGTALGAVVLALGIGGLAYSAGKSGGGHERAPRAFVPEFNVVEVPVPERPVPVGAMLRDAPLRLEKYPEHQLPRGVVREMAAVRERVALVALPAGLPIVNENIGSLDEASNPILGHILPGMRAMTVRVDATTSVEGWVRGGSIVDVLLVEKGKTSVVAEKVKVISAERSLSPLDGGSGPTVPSTVTLLVTQEQCLAINTAVPLGKISFALRSSRDIDSWRDTKFSPDDLSPSIGGAKIEGMVSVGSGSDERRFALVNGAWLPAESVPDGFLLKNRSE